MKEYCIYCYKRKTTNEVVYVGQTKNIKHRHNQHIYQDPFNMNLKEYNYPLSRGVRKYGTDYYILEILEDDLSFDQANEREKYWISFYDTYWNGYNQTKGGQVHGRREQIHDNIIEEIHRLLKDTSLSFEEIHQKTGVSLAHISNINTGSRRKYPNIDYPIRKSDAVGSKGIIFNKEEVLKIHMLLKDTKMSMNKIAQEFDCHKKTISNINKGLKQCYKLKDWEYPIRNTKQYARENSPFKKPE